MRNTRVNAISLTVVAIWAVLWSGHPAQAKRDLLGYQALAWGDSLYDVLQKTDGTVAVTPDGQRTVSFHRTLAGAVFVAVAIVDDADALQAVVLRTCDGSAMSAPQVQAVVQAYREKYGAAHQQERTDQTETWAWQFRSGALTLTRLEAGPASRTMRITYTRLDPFHIHPDDL
jgi:hypothetical protein